MFMNSIIILFVRICEDSDKQGYSCIVVSTGRVSPVTGYNYYTTKRRIAI